MPSQARPEPVKPRKLRKRIGIFGIFIGRSSRKTPNEPTNRLWQQSAAARCGDRQTGKSSAFSGVAQVEKSREGLFPLIGGQVCRA